MISFLRMVTRLFIVVVFAMSINTGTVKYEIFLRKYFSRMLSALQNV